MASANCVFLMGNLTRDPELRYLPDGQPVVTFSMAVNRTFTAQSGEKKQEASFFRIVVWGKSAENCNKFLSKGSQVFVEGRLRSRSWEAQDGTKRSTVEIVARSVQFLGRPKDRAPQGSPRGEAEGVDASAPQGEPVEAPVEEAQEQEEAPF